MKKALLIVVSCLLHGLTVWAQETIELSGEWECSVGDSTHYDKFVTLPGMINPSEQIADSLETANEKLWLRKNVYLPRTWKGMRATVFLERPLSETTLYVNGHEAGQQASQDFPHQFEISKYLVAGQRNKIEVCVSKGIVGLMGMKAQPKDLYINKWKIEPNVNVRMAQMTVSLAGYLSIIGDFSGWAQIWLEGKKTQPLFTRNILVSDYILLGGETLFWDEFHPSLYRMGVAFGDDYDEKTFGMRNFSVEDGQLSINDRPIWLRGTVDDGSRFSEAGYPSMDENTWTDIFKKHKEYGFNYMRFRGYCPPDAAFAAADKTGFYLQTDSCGKEEMQQLMETYGHHPSLMMLAPYGDVTRRIQEIGPWPAFPDTKEVREKLSDNGMPYQAELFMMASGQQQRLRYKDAIERNLRDEDKVGFLLPSFTPRASAKEWETFCSPVVALAQLPKCIYANTDTLKLTVEACNALYGEIHNARNAFLVTDDSMNVLTGGPLSVSNIPVAKNVTVGTICFPLQDIKRPTKLTLTVAVTRKWKNEWDFWVYPADSTDTADVPQDILVTDTLDATALDVLKKGGKVLLTARGKVQQSGLGTYIDKSHPLFTYDFPTDAWANRNWQELLDGAQAIDLTTLPKDYLSPVQPIDRPETCRKLGMMVETNVLKGKLLISTLDITSNLDCRPVARQLRKAILAYMQSDDFKPAVTLQPQAVDALISCGAQ